MNGEEESPGLLEQAPGKTVLLEKTRSSKVSSVSGPYLEEYLAALASRNFDEVISSELPSRQHALDRVYESQLTWWTRGWNAKTESVAPELSNLENECDRLYGIAARGGFGTPIIRNQGRSFAELEQIRAGGAI